MIRVATPVALTLMAVATFLPGNSIANWGLAIALLLAARFAHDGSRPGPRLAALAVVLGGATFARFPSWRTINLILFVMILVLIEARRSRREPARLAAIVGVLLWLCLRLFDPWVMLIALGLVGPALLAVEVLLKPGDRALVRVGGLAAWLLLVAAITYPDRPVLWGSAVLTPILLGAARLRPWDRVGSRPMVVTLGVAVALMLLLEARETPWELVYDYVPGGRAVRAVGRIGLAVLVPAALGLAAFFASPWAARRPIRAGLIGFACLAEQGATTPAYDKAAERARDAEAARLVDPTARAFYYRPRPGSIPGYWIDAMLMSLRTGVPTVDGYSGGWPRAWHPLVQIEWDRWKEPISSNPLTPRQALARWLGANGMTVDQVQIIGDDLDLVPPPIRVD